MNYDKEKIKAIAELITKAAKKMGLTKADIEKFFPRNPIVRHYVLAELRSMSEEEMKRNWTGRSSIRSISNHLQG